MLNAIPDTRNADDMSEIFLAPNEEIENDRKSVMEIEATLANHEGIDMAYRRKQSIGSSKSLSASSGEVCQGGKFDHSGNGFEKSLLVENDFLFRRRSTDY